MFNTLTKIALLLILFLFSTCGLECVEKKTGLHNHSTSIEESKEHSVFQFNLEPKQKLISLDSGLVLEIEHAWIENSWAYQCVNDKAVLKKDTFMQMVIQFNSISESIRNRDYAIMNKNRSASLKS